jgi:hypothetical protein
VAAGGSYVVLAGTGSPEDLGSDHYVFASDAKVLEGLAKGLLALAFGVDIGGIEEVDPGIEGGFNELIGAALVNGADVFPETNAAEGHGAETKG